MQWLQRNVKKSVIHVQSCYFTKRNLLLFAVLVHVAVVVAFWFYLIGHTERSYAQTQKLEPLFKTLTFTLRANSKGLRIAVTCMVIQ